jgi:general secretion pathway protein H
MPVPRAPRREPAAAQAGFTLIEVMAVMAIVALLASLAIGMSRGTGRGQLKALALETADLLRRQRLSAVLTGSRRQVFIDGGGRTLFGDGRKTVKLPEDVVLDVLGAGSERSGERAIVRFEPDGSSSGAAFRVSRDGFGYEIRVNWFTGGVSILDL